MYMYILVGASYIHVPVLVHVGAPVLQYRYNEGHNRKITGPRKKIAPNRVADDQ